jgi:hypothetical protein
MNLERLKYGAQRALRRVGFDPTAALRGHGYETSEKATVKAVAPFTMAPPDRVVAVCDAVRYVHNAGIPGDIVECGVWRGGMMMAAARTLLDAGDQTRHLYLYDTFAGMTDPSAIDEDARGKHASAWMRRYGRDRDGNSRWCNASLEDVRTNMASTGYPNDRCTFVQGPVEETIPATVPEAIAILRLDTDWHASTAHELEHLFPLLSPGAVLIVDDYGHWAGSRRAVDEYLERHGLTLLLARNDYSARMAVVPTGGRVPQ